MNFNDDLVTVARTEDFDMKTFQMTYHLSNLSKQKLTKLARVLRNESIPVHVIFACSYSYFSPSKDFLKDEGVEPTIDDEDKGGKLI